MITNSKVGRNGHITIPKHTRDELNIETSDVVFYEISHVVSPTGDTKYIK